MNSVMIVDDKLKLNCTTDSFNPFDYSRLDLVACCDNDGETAVIYSGDYDFLSLYGRLHDGACEPIHDFDRGANKENILKEAKTISGRLGLEFIAFYPFK